MPMFNVPGLGAKATTGVFTSLDTSWIGTGVEIAYNSGRGSVQAVARPSGALSPIDITGDSIRLVPGGNTGNALTVANSGVVTIAQGLAISAGGLIVAAGGASIAGVATLTGASGSLVARPGVNYTGGALDVGIVNVANLANVIISPNTNICTLSITCNSDGTSAIVGLRGGANVVDLFVSSGSWGTTAGGAHNFNVYYDGAGNYRFENRSGGICAVSFLRMGQVPNA